MKIVFATSNPNKVKEVNGIVGNQFNFISLKEIEHFTEIPEPFETIEENSLHKAKIIHELYKVNVMAEDTGLEVEALNGAPGVRSARFAGEPPNHDKNIDLLLEKLIQIEKPENRKARFKTVVSLILNDKTLQFTGLLEGHILFQRSGSKGFGYDPVFQPKGYQTSMGEMSSEQKNMMSHRYLAIKQLMDFLNNY